MSLLRWLGVLIIAVLMVLLILWVGRSYAEDTCYAFDAVIHDYTGQGYRIVELDDTSTKAVGKRLDLEPTRGFVMLYGEKLVMGLEVDGCTLPPIALRMNDLPMRFSGLSPWGTGA